jgi:hypothetical protein
VELEQMQGPEENELDSELVKGNEPEHESQCWRKRPIETTAFEQIKGIRR